MKNIRRLFWRIRHDFAVYRKSARMTPKVFVIGINKTGTTSLAEALRILGYDHFSTYFNKRPDIVDWRRKGDYRRLIRWARKFDSFDDGPWYNPDVIEKMDVAFPGSKFILLNRDENEYMKSYLTYFARRPNVKTLKNPDLIIEEFRRHRSWCLEYFTGRDEDFLDLYVKDENAFQRLSLFLDRPFIAMRLPHKNKTTKTGFSV